MEQEARQTIQQYLDNVGRQLSSSPEDERAEILRDLESHIYEAIEARTAGREATSEDACAVLAEMDPPECYGRAADGNRGSGGNRWTMGKIALGISIGFLLLAVVTALIPGAGRGASILSLIFGQLVALVLGIIARRDPYGKAAAICSAALLLVGILLTA